MSYLRLGVVILGIVTLSVSVAHAVLKEHGPVAADDDEAEWEPTTGVRLA